MARSQVGKRRTESLYCFIKPNRTTTFIDTLKNLPGADTKSILDTPSLFERVKPAFSGCDSGFEIAAQKKRVPRNSTMM